MKKIKAILKENLKALISLLAVVVAASGIVTSFFTARMTINTTKQQNAQQNAFVEQQNALQRKVAYSNLLTTAIAHLNDPKLGIRCGAAYEFKKIAIESEENREMIMEILTEFVREGIEKTPRTDSMAKNRPGDDVFLAAAVLSFLEAEYNFWITLQRDLRGLKADKLDLSQIKLQGAFLVSADFQGADLLIANLQGASLSGANLQGSNFAGTHLQGARLSHANFQDTILRGAELQGADLSYAKNLKVEQLLDGDTPAYIDSTTILDDALRNDPRIQARIKEVEAEQTANP